MHPHHAVVGVSVHLVVLVWPERPGHLGRAAICASCHQRCDGSRGSASLVGVVGHAVAHQVGAEVGVAEAELAEGAGVDPDLLGGVARRSDDDLLRQQHDVDGVLEGLDVQRAVGAAELHQVERGEVAGRVVDVHVLRAGVGGVDAPAVGRGVPVVDRGVVLHPGVGAAPGRLGDLAHQLPRGDRLADGLAGHSRCEMPVGALLDCAHELIGDAHRVVGVLVLDRLEAVAVDRHVEAGVTQRLGLVLLLGLAPDELADVGVVDVEHDHLGGTAGLAAGLDRAGPGVGAAHEGDGPGGGAALRQRLHRAADFREVDARARAAAEDVALLGVPGEDRLHRVLDGEDEAGAALRALLEADVEPHGRVEGGQLVQQDVRQLVVEGARVLFAGEVAAGASPAGDRAGDAADHLLDGVLALRGAELSAEVLLGDDVGRVLRPALGELDVLLLEGDAVAVSDAGVAHAPTRRSRTGGLPPW